MYACLYASTQQQLHTHTGVRKQVNENGNNMWGMLTTESFQPILEFDFLGPDSWGAAAAALGGKSEAELAALSAGDKLELRARQVRVCVCVCLLLCLDERGACLCVRGRG